MASEELHESPETLESRTIDQHRAIASIMEELEAVDWYAQRVDATQDTALRDVLAHNRDEELEHAAMAIEWLRRNNPVFDKFLRTYLFTKADIVGIEEEEEEAGAAGPEGASGGEGVRAASLGIGSLRRAGGAR